jgi:hypothetical protein
VKRRPQHVCAIRGCGVAIERWQRICAAHWRRLPFDQRRAIAQAGQDRAPHRVAQLVTDAVRWLAEHPPEAEAARRIGEAVE